MTWAVRQSRRSDCRQKRPDNNASEAAAVISFSILGSISRLSPGYARRTQELQIEETESRKRSQEKVQHVGKGLGCVSNRLRQNNMSMAVTQFVVCMRVKEFEQQALPLRPEWKHRRNNAVTFSLMAAFIAPFSHGLPLSTHNER